MSVNIQDLFVKTAMAGLVAGAVACGGKGGEGKGDAEGERDLHGRIRSRGSMAA